MTGEIKEVAQNIAGDHCAKDELINMEPAKFSTVGINNGTTLLGVIGDPVGQSLSPVMYNAVFTTLGWNCLYIPCHVTPEDLTAAVRGLRALNFKGINVTIPHKQAVYSEVDEVFGDARRSGSINTIIHQNGKLYGASTDGIGLVNSLKADGGFELNGKKVLLAGAGGTATAVIYSLIDAGIGELWLMNRSPAHAVSLKEKVWANTGFEVTVLENESLAALDWDSPDLIINTTSVGLYNDESVLPKVFLRKKHFVYDVVYKKGGTRLIREASETGCGVLTGLSMLLFQGAESFKLWFEEEPPLEIMRQALKTCTF
jgi:shikimate dehydrogenase